MGYIIVTILIAVTNIIMYRMGKRRGKDHALHQIVNSIEDVEITHENALKMLENVLDAILELAERGDVEIIDTDPPQKPTPPHDEM